MKDQRLCLDIISTLPENIIETILCHVPIQETARTSILSKQWRYKWTKIPKLVFHEDTFKAFTDENQESVLEQTFEEPSQRMVMGQRCKLFYTIYQVLLVHQGPILEFSLFMDADETCVEIDHIINHLARNNTIKKFTLEFTYLCSYKLPLSVFSLHQLTDLYLCNCTLYNKPTFSGFSSLTTLYIFEISVYTEALYHLVSSCPLLKSFTLLLNCYNICSDWNPTIIELFKCVPDIEDLTISNWVFRLFVNDAVPQELPTPLVHVKYFCIEELRFTNRHKLRSLVGLIGCFPNLEKIKLQISRELVETCWISISEDYSDIWLEHLTELLITRFNNLKPNLDIVKLVLDKSPVLKKVRILLDNRVSKDEELEILKILLRSPRESREVQIIVRR